MLPLIWTWMRISDPWWERLKGKHFNKAQYNPLSLMLSSIFVWNLRICLFFFSQTPTSRSLLSDWITSGTESQNVHCSSNKAPFALWNPRNYHCTSAVISVLIAVGEDASTSFTPYHKDFNAGLPWRLGRCCTWLQPGTTAHTHHCYPLPVVPWLFPALLSAKKKNNLAASQLGQTSSLFPLEEHYVNGSSSNHWL